MESREKSSQVRIARRRALYLEKQQAEAARLATQQKLRDVQEALFTIDSMESHEPLTNSFEAMIKYKAKVDGVKR